MNQFKTLLLLSGLTFGSLAQAATSVQTSRFVVGTASGTVTQGQTTTLSLPDINQGPDPATNTVLTYTPPTTPGVSVNSVTTSAGACTLTAGRYVCPAIPTVNVGQAATLQVNVTASSTAATGAATGTLSADSDQYNPGSGAGDSRYSIWGAPGVSGAAGDAFWFGFDGTYDDQGPKNEPPVGSQGQLSDLTGTWPVNQADPVGAYSLKYDDPSYGSSDNPADAVLPASPTHPLPYNAYGTTPGTVQGPSNQSVVKTPPTVLLPFAAQQTSQNNRRVWEIRSGFYLAQPTTVYACLSNNDDGMYIAIDPDQGGGVVAFNDTYALGPVDSGGTALAAGYHEVVYRIVNRNNQRQPSGSNSINGFSFETGTARFDEVGLGTAPSGSGQGSCSTADHDTFTRTAPPATFSVTTPPPANLYLQKTGPSYFRRGQSLTYTVLVSNSGAPATNVTVNDQLPPFVTFESADQPVTTGQHTVTWTVGSLGSNQVRILHLTVKVDAQQSLVTMANSVQVTLTEPNSGMTSTSSNPASLVNPVLTKTGRNITAGGSAGTDVRALPGDVLEYCVTAGNPYASVSGFIVTDAVPSNTTADLNGYGPGLGLQITRGGVTSTRTSTSADADGGSLDTGMRADLGTLANGETVRTCFRVTVN